MFQTSHSGHIGCRACVYCGLSPEISWESKKAPSTPHAQVFCLWKSQHMGRWKALILPTYGHSMHPYILERASTFQHSLLVQQVCILSYALTKQIEVLRLFWNINHNFVTLYIFISYIILFSTMLFLLPIRVWTGTSPSVISGLCSQHSTQWYIRQDYCSAF